MLNNSHKIMKKLIAIVLIGSIVTACNGVSGPEHPVPSLGQCDRGIPELNPGVTLDDVDTSLRSGEPCAPPCWQGLVPGESTDKDVMETLEGLPFVRQDSILRRDWSGDSEWETIEWHSSVSLAYGSVGNARLNPEDKVAWIGFELEYELTLQELIGILGKPDMFTVLYNPPDCHETWIVWLDDGLAIWPMIESTTDDEPLIDPNRHVKAVQYFPPVTTLQEYLIGIKAGNYEAAHEDSEYWAEWTGFDNVRLSTIYPEG